MKAIILAAGYGNRMRPLTDNCHKTLLTVGEKTIIGRILEGLKANDVNDIVIVTGYRHEELETYLKKHYHSLNITFVRNEKYRETNNIYSMALAFEQTIIDTDIILIESDLVYRSEVITKLISSPYKNVALVDKFRSGMDGTVVTVENNMITSVIPPHLQPETFDFSDKFKTLNIYKFSKEFCNTSFKKLLIYYANTIDKNCYYELILGILIYMQKEVIHAEIVEGEQWAEVDDPNDLHVAQFVFNENRTTILENAFGGFWNYDLIDFCFIRNMYFPNSSIISEMRNNLPNLIHNYGSKQEILDRKMAWFLLCKETNVVALNGASQVYPFLENYFEGKTALIPDPTFGEYTRVFKSATRYEDNVGIDDNQIKAKSVDKDVIVFVNPNNPTGSIVSTEWIFNFALENPSKQIVVDESFIEFSDQESILKLLEKQSLDNIVVLKSLSKSLGVPGIRFGYCYSCDQQFTNALRRWLPIWNMNSMAEFMLEIILKSRPDMVESFRQTKEDRELFKTQLESVSYVKKVYPSDANFLLVKIDHPKYSSAEIRDLLLNNESLYVKDVSSKFKDQSAMLRLAVRLPKENEYLVTRLKSLV